MFALARLSESVVLLPPSWKPSVPDDESEEPTARVEVEVVFTRPVEPTYATPCVRDGSRSADENVELAVEKSPPPKPMAVEVLLYPVFTVNGNCVKFASFVSCDVLIVDVAKEYVWPFAPMPAKPEVREPSVRVPMLAAVAEAYANEPSVVEEFVKI
jgi:hypothetical protein